MFQTRLILFTTVYIRNLKTNPLQDNFKILSFCPTEDAINDNKTISLF